MAEESLYVTEARYGPLQVRERFHTTDASLKRGEECVLRTERGVEAGVLTRDAAALPGRRGSRRRNRERRGPAARGTR